jgi:hypothetical protein
MEVTKWSLLATKAIAVKDAAPAEERFPVVIHHPGLSGVADDSSVLCEILASHGYVVLCSAYPNWYGVALFQWGVHTGDGDAGLLVPAMVEPLEVGASHWLVDGLVPRVLDSRVSRSKRSFTLP